VRVAACLLFLACGPAFEDGALSSADASSPRDSKWSAPAAAGLDAGHTDRASPDAFTAPEASQVDSSRDAYTSDVTLDSGSAPVLADAAPDASSVYAACVAAFLAGCDADPSACAYVTVQSECGPPPGGP
jgi:hypothetical protein